MLRRVSPGKSMTIRLFGALLCGAALVLVTSTGSYAKSTKKQGPRDPRKQHFLRFFSKWRALRAGASIRQGRDSPRNYRQEQQSNTSDRMGGGGGKSYDNETQDQRQGARPTATADPARDSMEVGAASKLPSRLSPRQTGERRR